MKENEEVVYKNAEDVGKAEPFEEELSKISPVDEETENVHHLAGVLSAEERKSEQRNYVFFIIAGIIVAVILITYILTTL